MADIRKNLVLVDKFTSVFDRFIAKNEKINKTLERTADVTDELTGATYRWTAAVGQYNKQALLATNTIEELVSQGFLAQESAGQMAEKVEELGDEAEEAGASTETAIEKVDRASAKGASKIGRLLRRAGVQLFGLHKIIQMVKQAFERAPDDIAKPWTNLKTNVMDTVARFATSVLVGMSSGMERLNQAFSSPAGERLVKFLQVGFEAVGMLIGFAAERLADFIEFLGNQLTNTGDSFADLFEFLGGGIGAIYVTAHNILATLWNAVASFAEFLMNVFNHPFDALVSLIRGIADFALDSLNVVAKAIDKIFGSHLSGTINGWKNDVKAWAERNYSGEQIELDRMDMIEYDDYMGRFAAAGRNLGARLSSAGLERESLRAIKGIEQNTSAIKEAVTDEDLKMLIDMATRRFISNVNLTAQTPVITVNGANTGNTEADRNALARAIRDILVEQLASNSTTGYYAVQGA